MCILREKVMQGSINKQQNFALINCQLICNLLAKILSLSLMSSANKVTEESQ